MNYPVFHSHGLRKKFQNLHNAVSINIISCNNHFKSFNNKHTLLTSSLLSFHNHKIKCHAHKSGKKHSKKVFHFKNVHNHPFIMFIQDNSPDFFLKASHPQNSFCTLLSLDFIKTVFVLFFCLIMICTFHKSHLFIL